MAAPAIYGDLVQVHCHGNVRSSLELVAERCADLFEPVEPPPDGDIEFDEAVRQVEGRMTLGGNIESRLIETGTEQDVRDAVEAVLRSLGRRIVLMDSAGSVGTYTRTMVRNYHAIMDAWELLS